MTPMRHLHEQIRTRPACTDFPCPHLRVHFSVVPCASQQQKKSDYLTVPNFRFALQCNKWLRACQFIHLFITSLNLDRGKF
jgi:hypothetical protein